MLVEFRVENHRSLRDEQVLSMEAGPIGDPADLRPRHVKGYSKPLLPVVALYGANASGKSNVLAALYFMRETVLFSHHIWAPDGGVPRDPFAWGPKRDEPSMFEVVFLVDDVRYQYGFVASDEQFLEEWLFAWPKNKKQIWHERDKDHFHFYDNNLKGGNSAIKEVTRRNALYLSVAAQHRHPQLSSIFRWFENLKAKNMAMKSMGWAIRNGVIHMRTPDWDTSVYALLESQSLDRQPSFLSEEKFSLDELLDGFKSLLKGADIGIVDVRLSKTESENSRRPSVRRYELKHKSDAENAWLPLDEESKGTQTLFHIAFPMLRAMQTGATIIVDELESSLHPSIARQIVRQFNDPAVNKHNAQLIFTTHDTNLLGAIVGEPALRRDQVWLTEKGADGATVLYPLTDYKPRKEENLERGYLQGRFGAIPFLGDFRLTGE